MTMIDRIGSSSAAILGWRRILARPALAALAVAVFALGLTACGGDGAGEKDEGRIAVKIGVPPVGDVAPVFLGIEKGFFAAEELELEPRFVQAGPVVVASVVSGDLQFGFSNTTSLIVAASRGLRPRIITRAALGSEATNILVRRDSPISDLGDLEGKTIGVSALESHPTLTTNAALEKRGVDISKVRYIEVPLPQALAALEARRVDAAYVAEPFSTLGLQAGHRSISRPTLEIARDYILAAYFTTDEYLANHKETVDRFARAMNRSLDYAAAHPEEVRSVVSTYTEIRPELAAKMTLSEFSRHGDTSTLELTADLAERYGYLGTKPDISDLLYEP